MELLIGLLYLIYPVILILRLARVIKWSWWVVLAPIYVPLILLILKLGSLAIVLVLLELA